MTGLSIVFGKGLFQKTIALSDILIIWTDDRDGKVVEKPLDVFLKELVEKIKKLEEKTGLCS